MITAPGLRNIFLGQFMFFANVSTFLNNLPPYLSQIDHLTSSQIALRLWPSCLGLILGAMVTGKVLRKTVKYRKVSLVGVAICVASLIVMTIRWKDGIIGVEVHYGFPWSVGSGVFLSAQFIALSVRCPGQMANATAIYCLIQQIGQIVGTSGSTAALRGLFGLRLGVNLDDILPREKAKIIRGILHNYESIATLPENLQKAVQSSYIVAFRLVPALAMILSTISGVLIIFT
ncbi:hypothetical protein ACN38_g12150 [Penicillium nordicum]|uniref:Major facilitator superfamily (MFS) profile domain-containing protein n=1 Tax=Penicillium nordicum TaxID=229535 RepID=A0A0M9WA80_9EURO|nr:hypothetical protein ACN38_g12150 [Penicillium nordicum]